MTEIAKLIDPALSPIQAAYVSLAEAIRIVTRELDAAEAEAGSYAADPANYHARHRAAIERCAARLAATVGARTTNRWDGARVRILGITSSSTIGTGGALRNWLAAARRREGARDA